MPGQVAGAPVILYLLPGRICLSLTYKVSFLCIPMRVIVGISSYS